MKLTELGLYNPYAVVVTTLLLFLFGGLALQRLPVQLTPELQEPQISITTLWPGAAAEEVESEIVEPQEDVLRGLQGMTRLVSSISRGQAQITITFRVATDLDSALVKVVTRLNQVSRYPAEARQPVLSTVGANAGAIAWFVLSPEPGNARPIASYYQFVRDVVQARFEQVPGVAQSEFYGGREDEIRILFDPYKLAAAGVSITVAQRYINGSLDGTSGASRVGKREYVLRFLGRYSPEELKGLILAWRDGRPVYLQDVARVERALKDRDSFVIASGRPVIAVNAQREAGVNVIQVMGELQRVARELQDGPLRNANLRIQQVYDETEYIHQSIQLLYQSLGLGIFLAFLVLLLFLRDLRATLLIAGTIPLCLLGTLVAMSLSGRTMNIISLASLAFAVGMVMDASIVVLENIMSRRERGASAHTAAVEGTGEVWGALLASTATTVAVFLPVLFLRSEVGQLFGDLAFVITAAVCVSLFFALYVTPTAATLLLGPPRPRPERGWEWRFACFLRALSGPLPVRLLWIVALISLPVWLTLQLLVRPDYLPTGNRNLVMAFVTPAPGAAVDFLAEDMGEELVRRLRPHFKDKQAPAVKHYFIVQVRGQMFMGVVAEDPKQLGELEGLLRSTLSDLPDTLSFAQRASLFSGFSDGRSIDMDIQARELEPLFAAAQKAFLHTQEILPGVQLRPQPGLELAQPEVRMAPDERRLAEHQMTRVELGGILRAMGDGLLVGQYFDGRRNLDVVARAEGWQGPEEFKELPIATSSGEVVPLGELLQVRRAAGAEKIRRVNRSRAVTLSVAPPGEQPLDITLEKLRQEVEPLVREALPEAKLAYAGTADKLHVALKDLGRSLLLASLILLLLMASLFRSFRDSFLVMLTLPLASVGGLLVLRALQIIDPKQQLDLLTIIGFVIMLGIVVNNAILLVCRAREAEKRGLDRDAAVTEAVSSRLRPILMSTLTNIFGMLPLVLVPGPGSEIYRGLAGVIVGGMAVSTLFTLMLMPNLLRLGGKRPTPTAPSPVMPSEALAS